MPKVTNFDDADITELERIRRLLRQAGFKPGRAFIKGRQFRQPVYGRESLERFLQMVGERDA